MVQNHLPTALHTPSHSATRYPRYPLPPLPATPLPTLNPTIFAGLREQLRHLDLDPVDPDASRRFVALLTLEPDDGLRVWGDASNQYRRLLKADNVLPHPRNQHSQDDSIGEKLLSSSGALTILRTTTLHNGAVMPCYPTLLPRC